MRRTEKNTRHTKPCPRAIPRINNMTQQCCTLATAECIDGGAKCPLWVISGHLQCKRHLAKGQKRTFRLFDHLVGASE